MKLEGVFNAPPRPECTNLTDNSDKLRLDQEAQQLEVEHSASGGLGLGADFDFGSAYRLGFQS